MQYLLVKYILTIFLASFFHKSAIFLVLFVVLPLINSFNVRKLSVIYIGVYFLTLFFPEKITSLINIDIINTTNLNVLNIKYDEVYLKSMNVKLGFGSLLLTIIFIFTIYSYNKISKKYLLLYNISIIYFITNNLSYSIPMIGRLTMYFMPLLIVVYPLVVSSYRNILNRTIVKSIIVFYYMFELYSFFNNPRWHYFNEYDFIIDI